MYCIIPLVLGFVAGRSCGFRGHDCFDRRCFRSDRCCISDCRCRRY